MQRPQLTPPQPNLPDIRQAGRRRRFRRRRPHPRRRLTPVMLHMRLDQMTRSKSRTQTQLASKNSTADDASELAGVAAGRGEVGAADAEEVEHGGLGAEEGAAADCADFD